MSAPELETRTNHAAVMRLSTPQTMEGAMPESPEQSKPRSVSDYTAEELVSRAVRNARPHECGESPRWVAIQDTFALGSTYSIQLCRIHGLDPEEKVNGPRCISCNP